ncbi:MAG: general stress protein [Cyanobacteria bacterium P01_A01_bin.37]
MASDHRRAIGLFPDRPKTASALQALSDSGFNMSHVSIVARDAKREDAIAGVDVKDEVSNQADTGGSIGALTGGVLGGVTGLLVGLGTFTIPGIGPALLAGEAAAVISTLVGGAAGAAAGGLVGALIGLGIPEHRAKHYRDRVADGNYLVMLKDREPEIARAERTLKRSGIED